MVRNAPGMHCRKGNNLREADTIDMMAHMERGMIGKRLRHKDLIA